MQAEDNEPQDPHPDESSRDLLAEIEALWEQLQDYLPPEERETLEGTPRERQGREGPEQFGLFADRTGTDQPVLEAYKLFDGTVSIETRLKKLCRWIDLRRGQRCSAHHRALLRWLLDTSGAAIPLHLIFEGEATMQVTILNPNAVRDWDDEVPVLDGWDEENFLRRFSGLAAETIDYLQDAESKYMVLLGLEPWETFYATAADYQQAVECYELVVTRGRSGLVEHEREAFAYLVARERGLDAETAATFQRFKLIYLFAKGLATDDEIPSLDDEDEVVF